MLTWEYGTFFFFIPSISLLSKNYLGVRDLKSVTSKKTEEVYIFGSIRKPMVIRIFFGLPSHRVTHPDKDENSPVRDDRMRRAPQENCLYSYCYDLEAERLIWTSGD